MPYLAFASNFTWVMVIGILGPSIPKIIEDLGISYPQAGLFFTMLSLGSLFGTTLTGIASDYLNRKALFALVALVLAVGLASMGLASSYLVILLIILFYSLFGSPAGTVGQSIMLSMYPHRRERYISLQTSFAALGSFTAPLLVALNFTVGLSWRWTFIEAGGLAILLFLWILIVRLPRASGRMMSRGNISRILGNPRILFSALLIFLSVAPDFGFSYWLAEHFKTELGVPLSLSSAVVSVFLIGMISGRLLTSRLLKRFSSARILKAGMALSLISLIVFLTVPWIPVKLVTLLLYGLGTAPVFPLLMARGTGLYPDQPGTVSGVLFGSVSLGGMAFPLVLGAVASAVGIRLTYILVGVIILALLLALIGTQRWWERLGRQAEGGHTL
ncbi:MAG: MFS transporter [Spirochaetaceae bacterium]|nr:MAG: MFS transporter [Spirochaetaceae bacterium]